MSKEKDPYKVLGVLPNASVPEIRESYRKLSKMFHPDVFWGDEAAQEKAKEMFEEVAKAAQILLNKDKKLEYDRWGHEGPPEMDDLGILGMEGKVFGIDLEEFVGNKDVRN